MKNENSPTANFTKAMKTDNIARIVTMFLSLAIYIGLLILPFTMLNGKPAFSSIEDVKAYLGMAIIFLMVASIPLGFVILRPGFPKDSTKSLRKKFFRGLNKFVLILGCIPVIGWLGWIVVIVLAYIGIPMMFGYFAGPVYLVIFLIRFIQRKPLIFNYEIPKYEEEISAQ